VEKRPWADIDQVASWEVVTCDSLAPGALEYLSAGVDRACYLRGGGPRASVLASVYYSGDGRLAGVEVFEY
jgi:hypothetical protein